VTNADATVFVTRTNEQDFARCYGSAVAERFWVIPNGCDVSEFGGLKRRVQDDAFVLLHAGSLYGARNPAVLFTAVARAIMRGGIDPERFRLRLIGRLNIAGIDLQVLVRNLGLERVVEFIPQMPRRAVLQEMVDASALLILQPLTTVSIPGKLYEYMAAGRPILALAEPDGETAALVRSSGVGITVPPNDEALLEHALTRLVDQSHAPFPPVDRETYDGALRASELAYLLSGVVNRHLRPIALERGRLEKPQSAEGPNS
jgi:glycosyltransferase involved in cell wall biosynthesis